MWLVEASNNPRVPSLLTPVDLFRVIAENPGLYQPVDREATAVHRLFHPHRSGNHISCFSYLYSRTASEGTSCDTNRPLKIFTQFDPTESGQHGHSAKGIPSHVNFGVIELRSIVELHWFAAVNSVTMKSCREQLNSSDPVIGQKGSGAVPAVDLKIQQLQVVATIAVANQV